MEKKDIVHLGAGFTAGTHGRLFLFNNHISFNLLGGAAKTARRLSAVPLPGETGPPRMGESDKQQVNK